MKDLYLRPPYPHLRRFENFEEWRIHRKVLEKETLANLSTALLTNSVLNKFGIDSLLSRSELQWHKGSKVACVVKNMNDQTLQNFAQFRASMQFCSKLLRKDLKLQSTLNSSKEKWMEYQKRSTIRLCKTSWKNFRGRYASLVAAKKFKIIYEQIL